MATPDNSPNEGGMRHEERIAAMLQEALIRMIPALHGHPQRIPDDDGAEIGFTRCRDGFGQIAAILKAIETQAGHSSEVGRLAGAGLHIARDLEDLAGRWCEETATVDAIGN